MNRRKLKIAFNIDHFILQRGGAERYLADLVKFLLKNGHEVHIFAMDGDDTIITPATNYRFHKVPVINWTRFLKSLSFTVMSSLMIKREKFDIVQALGKNLTMNIFQPHGGSHRASLRQNILAFSENAFIRRIYALLRIMDPKMVLFLGIEWLQFHKKEYPEILCISKMVMADLKKYYNVPDKKLHLIYNGVDSNRFSIQTRLKLRAVAKNELKVENSKVILFIGHNFKLKGLKYFLQTISVIEKSNPELNLKAFILGKGNKKAYLKMINYMGLSKICEFAVADNIEKFYSIADLLIQPTFYDPCSLAVLEALSCGVAVITTAFNGAGELIEKGVTGDIVDDPRNVLEIARSAEKFLKISDTEKTAFLANESVKQYNNETVHNRILRFYLDFVQAKLV